MGNYLDKNLRRVLGHPGTEKYLAGFYDSIKTPSELKAFNEACNRFGPKAAIVAYMKEAYAELTDSEAAAVADAVIDSVITGKGDAYGSWMHSGKMGFEEVLSQLKQPKGGTENLTNVASPGMPPGKISAVPGESGSSTGRAGSGKQTYPRTYKPYESAGTFSSTEPKKQPSFASVNPSGAPHLSHGPVGTAGDTDQPKYNPYDARMQRSYSYRRTLHKSVRGGEKILHESLDQTKPAGIEFLGNVTHDDRDRVAPRPGYLFKAPTPPLKNGFTRSAAIAMLLNKHHSDPMDFTRPQDQMMDEEEDDEAKRREALRAYGYSEEEIEAMRLDSEAERARAFGDEMASEELTEAAKSLRKSVGGKALRKDLQ